MICKRATVSIFALAFFIRIGLWIATSAAAEAETNSPNQQSQITVPSLQQIDELYQAKLRALEEARREAEAVSKQNAEALAARLNLVEQALTTQRQRELESLQSSNRLTLAVAAVIAVIGFLAMIGTVFFFMRGINRQAVPLATFPFRAAIPDSAGPAALMAGEMKLATLNPAEQSSARFLGAIAQLEKRIQDLQHSATAAAPDPAQSNGRPATPVVPVHSETALASSSSRAASEQSGRVSLLLSKGETLMNLHQSDRALACFEEVIALDPGNIEALIKRGQTFEQLQRMAEAIECYDRAIAMDSSATVAYLYKGGVLNRLQRFQEALECYEQALLAREDSASMRRQAGS
jgi:tetratricopeptide (TPR) repeat protein